MRHLLHALLALLLSSSAVAAPPRPPSKQSRVRQELERLAKLPPPSHATLAPVRETQLSLLESFPAALPDYIDSDCAETSRHLFQCPWLGVILTLSSPASGEPDNVYSGMEIPVVGAVDSERSCVTALAKARPNARQSGVVLGHSGEAAETTTLFTEPESEFLFAATWSQASGATSGHCSLRACNLEAGGQPTFCRALRTQVFH